MIYTTDTTARALYDAMLAAANEPREDYTPVEFKHVRMRLTVLHKNLRATAAKVLKNWQAFGGGQKPKAEKTRAVTWPAGALSVFRAAIEDKNYAAALQLASDRLGVRAYVFRDGPVLTVCQIPAPDIGEGFSSIMLETGMYSVTHLRTGVSVGRAFKTRAKALESARMEKARRTPEAWDAAVSQLANKPTAADAIAEWVTLHGITPDTVAPSKPDSAAVMAPERPIEVNAPARKPASSAAHADPMAKRASARKRQLQRAIAGQLAPHLVANLERNGLLHNGQATRRGRFLYLDDATI